MPIACRKVISTHTDKKTVDNNHIIHNSNFSKRFNKQITCIPITNTKYNSVKPLYVPKRA